MSDVLPIVDSALSLTEEEYNALCDCESEAEWNALCAQVQGRRNGRYPHDWYDKILASGLMRQKNKEWGLPTGMTVIEIRSEKKEEGGVQKK